VNERDGLTASLRALRDEQGVDQTLQNLLRALTLNLELRARYRVFEFEAGQEGYPETAQLFRELRDLESDHIGALLAGLRSRLGDVELPSIDAT
jgi:rubrerythrin